jgi:DNA-binding XRE family transcriptional regulator
MALRRQGLSQRRKAVGLTQESLAGQLGVERSTVVRWEAGDTEPLPWIRPKLARALHVSIDQLAELLTTSENADTTRALSADTVEVLRRAPHIAGEDVGLDKPVPTTVGAPGFAGSDVPEPTQTEVPHRPSLTATPVDGEPADVHRSRARS